MSGRSVRPYPVEHLSPDQRGPGPPAPGNQARVHPAFSFDDPAAAAQIMAPMPPPADGKAPRRPRAPKGLPPYLASLYEVPLLDRDQEAHLFRQMNFLKFQAQKLRQTIDPTRAKTLISIGSRSFRKTPWPSRTRSSGRIFGWSSRLPSGTSARRITFSSWSPTAT